MIKDKNSLLLFAICKLKNKEKIKFYIRNNCCFMNFIIIFTEWLYYTNDTYYIIQKHWEKSYSLHAN